MSVLFYLFIGLAVAFTLCFVLSAHLNKKALTMILQLQKDIRQSSVTLEQALATKSDLEVAEVDQTVAEFEKRYKKVESIHKLSRLSLYFAVGLSILDILVLAVYVMVGN